MFIMLIHNFFICCLQFVRLLIQKFKIQVLLRLGGLSVSIYIREHEDVYSLRKKVL
jgi:hypothetical protein